MGPAPGSGIGPYLAYFGDIRLMSQPMRPSISNIALNWYSVAKLARIEGPRGN